MLKLLIVEDEVILRKGICTLIPWTDLGFELVGDFSNGLQALEFMQKNKIDLVVSDIEMPEINGLELAGKIQQSFPQTKVIILTAYTDFNYAQQSIRYGVSDYIIKGNFVKLLPIAAQKAAKEIRALKNSFLSADSTQLLPIVLSGLINGTIFEPTDIQYWIKTLHLKAHNFFIVRNEISWNNSCEHASKQERDEQAIQNFYHLAFENYDYFAAWISSEIFVMIVSFPNNEETANQKRLYSVLEDVISTIENYMPFSINIGISLQHNGLESIQHAYQEAEFATKNTNIPDHKIALFKKNAILSNQTLQTFCENFAKEMLELLLNYNNNAPVFWQDIIAFEPVASLPFQQFKQTISTILNYCQNRLICSDDLFGFDLLWENIYIKLQQCNNIEELFLKLKNSTQQLLTYHYIDVESCNYLVPQVNNYIKEHYSKPVRIDDVANDLHVNSNYLSRIYKRNTGNSIVSAFNRYRISKSKVLLKNNLLLVSEVGSMVGYDDPAYFTNVFTKYVGTSPSNYKEQL